jgi:hypothetical protein
VARRLLHASSNPNKETTMKKLLTTLLLIAACASTPVDPPPSGSGPLELATPPEHCAAACRVSLGACSTSAEDRALVTDCSSDCPFDDAQRACLESIACGDDTAACD